MLLASFVSGLTVFDTFSTTAEIPVTMSAM
jgi:hypothetical protein